MGRNNAATVAADAKPSPGPRASEANSSRPSGTTNRIASSRLAWMECNADVGVRRSSSGMYIAMVAGLE